MNKEECLEALEKIKNDQYFIAEDDEGDLIHIVNLYKNELKTLRCLIEEHFDNPPLSFDDLEVGEAYWDNLRECWFIVTEYDLTGYYQEKEICWYFDKNGACYLENISKNEFDENRYYRKQVE